MNMNPSDIELLRGVMPDCEVRILGFEDHIMLLRVFYNQEIRKYCIEICIPPRDVNDQDILQFLDKVTGDIGYKYRATDTFDNGVKKIIYAKIN